MKSIASIYRLSTSNSKMSTATEGPSKYSLLYQEYPQDDPYIQKQFSKVATNRVLNALITSDFKPSTIINYISAVKNNGFNILLTPYSIKELQEAEEITDYWLFPTSWTQAIKEEIAYKTGDVNDPILQQIIQICFETLKNIIPVNLTLDIFGTIYHFEEPEDENMKWMSYRIIKLVAWAGEFELMKYMYENCPVLHTHYLTYEITINCSTRECLEYVHSMGCPLETNVTLYAVRYNRLDCLQYAYENGCLLHADIMEEAAFTNNLACMKYLHEVCNIPWTDKVTEKIVTNQNSLECLKYAHENGCLWDEQICEKAATYNNLECLKYAHENGCSWDEYTTSETSKYTGTYDCLKYLIENGCPTDTSVMKNIARHGNLEMLKYLHEKGCPWDGTVAHKAAKYGSLECLKYLIENGCPWFKDSICNDAIKNNKYKRILNYLIKKGAKLTSDTFHIAACDGTVKMLKLLHKNKCPFNKVAMANAVYAGSLSRLKYLRKIGCPWDKLTHIYANRNKDKHPECYQYVVENGCPTE